MRCLSASTCSSLLASLALKELAAYSPAGPAASASPTDHSVPAIARTVIFILLIFLKMIPSRKPDVLNYASHIRLVDETSDNLH
jgi:hypothetical protein